MCNNEIEIQLKVMKMTKNVKQPSAFGPIGHRRNELNFCIAPLSRRLPICSLQILSPAIAITVCDKVSGWRDGGIYDW